MIRLAIAVEGETEEEFVKNVLAPHLRDRGVESYPIKPGGRGGSISVERLASEMARLRRNFDFVTSLVDLYGFRNRRQAETVEQLEERVDGAVDSAVGHDRERSRVFAYVQRHEFEGLLFSKVDAFGLVPGGAPDSVAALRSIRAAFPTPEDINDGVETAPSKRIVRVFTTYRKRLYGPLVAEEIGLANIREECLRFDAWVGRLESLGDP